jgi:type IV pilus assembly protein PilY1
MSKDHQLSYRAYDEYSDLDGDGISETTYKHSFNYYGYFDSYKCYQYSGTSSRFEPVSITSDKYCSGNWSGNFLNWATMSRMDVLRKVLYGGLRSTDSSSSGTVLERAFLPTDAHSFAKYYKGADLTKLTPFDASQTAPIRAKSGVNDNSRSTQYTAGRKEYIYPGSVPTGGPAVTSCQATVDAYIAAHSDPLSPVTAPDDYNCIWFKTGSNFGSSFTPVVGDQLEATYDVDKNGVAASTEKERITGTVIALDGSQNFTLMVTSDGFTGTSTTARKDWVFTILSQTSASMCNTTLGSDSGDNRYSHTNTNAPLLRIAKGDYQLWNANERWQCYWSEEKSASNGNSVAITGLASASSNPSKASQGIKVGANGPDFTVRVKVCDPAMIGKENCEAYPNGNYQPIGLLQQYGETNSAEFALLTGSFAKNTSGGVIRSNMGSFRTEVNYKTDGTFTSANNIVYTLNKLRIYGYDYNDGTYIGADNCTFQLTGLTDNQCTSWGNPMGEMFLETLRYLGGLTPTTAFTYTNFGSKDAALGLPQPKWVDPFTRGSDAARVAVEAEFGAAQCRPIDTINFNSSVTSYDQDQWSGSADLPGSPSVAAYIDIIGNGEGIPGHDWFVGNNGSLNNGLCTSKSVSALSSVNGLCPDAPSYKGSFALAGLAHWARNHQVRPKDEFPDWGYGMAFKVKSYSVAMSPGKPRITVIDPVSKNKIVIQPAYRLNKSATAFGAGTLVDFRVIKQDATSGSFLVIWEDSEQGGDYDQDASGILRYEVVDGKLYVYTRTFADATVNPQGFGYTISGSNKDGVHFHSGILNFDFSDLSNLSVTKTDGTAHPNVNATGGCAGCAKNQPESRATYTFSGTTGGTLQDPLWYAAKWGGFTGDGVDTSAKPTSTDTWDVKKLDGSAGADGIPDNYFLAIRPDELEKSLRTVFADIVSSSNTSPAVSAAQLTEGSLKYVVKFDSKDNHGEISAYAIGADGYFGTVPKWNAHEQISLIAPASRSIITNEGATGVALRWASLSAATRSVAFGTDSLAEKRLDWYRGDRTNEAPSGAGFRGRNSLSVIGSIINSNPHVQRKPSAPLFGDAFTGYGDFVTANKDRRPVIWVGSNDGMLHAFDASSFASGGGSLISYLPQPLHSKLGAWIKPGALQAMADGSPFTADVQYTKSATETAWATYLFSSLGRGAKGIFALDVTDTGTLKSDGTLTAGSLSEGNAASIFRWQFTEADDSSGDLGYIVEQDNTPSRFTGQSASVAKMNNGKFAVMYGNGVNSVNGSAALYIMFVDGPVGGAWSDSGATRSYVKIVADVGPNNGLSQPTWVDTNGDGVADIIYAGDLKGNLWKFDVSSKDVSKWALAYLDRPLFKAHAVDGSASSYQPITSAPTFSFHPNGGILVSFGTGKALSSTDFPDASGRKFSIYGIWDKSTFATMDATALDNTSTGLPRLRTQLVLRTLNRESSGNGYVSGGAINWSTKFGWYIDLPITSEMVVSNVQTVTPKLLAAVSIAPTTGAASCGNSPDAYVTFINPITGLLTESIFGEMTVVGDPDPKLIASLKLEKGDQNITFSKDDTAKKDPKCTGVDCPPITPGQCFGANGGKTQLKGCPQNKDRRIQWREIFNFKTGVE